MRRTGGRDGADVARQLRVCEATAHRGRPRYGGLEVQDLKMLEQAKSVVAEQALDIRIPLVTPL